MRIASGVPLDKNFFLFNDLRSFGRGARSLSPPICKRIRHRPGRTVATATPRPGRVRHAAPGIVADVTAVAVLTGRRIRCSGGPPVRLPGWSVADAPHGCRVREAISDWATCRSPPPSAARIVCPASGGRSVIAVPRTALEWIGCGSEHGRGSSAHPVRRRGTAVCRSAKPEGFSISGADSPGTGRLSITACCVRLLAKNASSPTPATKPPAPAAACRMCCATLVSPCPVIRASLRRTPPDGRSAAGYPASAWTAGSQLASSGFIGNADFGQMNPVGLVRRHARWVSVLQQRNHHVMMIRCEPPSIFQATCTRR